MNYKHKLSRRLALIFDSSLALAVVLSAGCAGADSKTGFEPAIDTTVSSIVLTPEKSIAAIGEPVRILAYGHSEVSDSTPVQLDWEASGGTVSPDGVFQADALGDYVVRGTTRNENRVSGSAHVSIGTAVSGPSNGGPNEPLGYTYLSSRPFDRLGESGWQERQDPWFSIVLDPASPGTSPTVGQAKFPAGFAGGRGPINTLFDLPRNHHELYVSFWIKLSPNWIGHPSGVNKILFFWIDHGARIYLSAQGSGSGTLQPQVRLQAINETPVSRNLHPNLSSAVIQRGVWQRWEIRLRANAPGMANGSADWWIDGAPVGSYTGINFVGPGASNDWEQVSWNPTWGGTGSVVPLDQTMQIDDIYISAR